MRPLGWQLPKAFLGTSDIEVTEISLLHGQSRVKAQVSWECYNETAVESTNSNLPSKSFDVNGVYKISDGSNKFTLIGCNSMAYLRSQQTADGPYPYVYYTGCLSYCEDTSKVINGVCNGIGCYQTSIPSGLNYYSFNATDLTMDTNKSMPLWLDWAVRDAATCEEAKGSDNYACRSQNSVCSKARSGAGYLCNCSEGYQGNPYLVDGCQDIDECKLPEKYPCYGVCSNLPGSYHCTCPPGKRGDPFNGPCVLSSLFVTKIVIGNSLISILFPHDFEMMIKIWCLFCLVRDAGSHFCNAYNTFKEEARKGKGEAFERDIEREDTVNANGHIDCVLQTKDH
ncbi:wall-associated receptor kinase 2-like [Musa acuminata AAA Group]|uniref:wall-associated receptor kinase 2-like n=1 Tax=Musa acuminata AAA Group TaxID=214697 RepID=UPI0031E38258